MNGNKDNKTFHGGGVAGAKHKTMTRPKIRPTSTQHVVTRPAPSYSRDVPIQKKQGSMVDHGMKGRNALTCVFQKCVPR
jgi:hypothetical protein